MAVERERGFGLCSVDHLPPEGQCCEGAGNLNSPQVLFTFYFLQSFSVMLHYFLSFLCLSILNVLIKKDDLGNIKDINYNLQSCAARTPVA